MEISSWTTLSRESISLSRLSYRCCLKPILSLRHTSSSCNIRVVRCIGTGHYVAAQPLLVLSFHLSQIFWSIHHWHKVMHCNLRAIPWFTAFISFMHESTCVPSISLAECCLFQKISLFLFLSSLSFHFFCDHLSNLIIIFIRP